MISIKFTFSESAHVDTEVTFDSLRAATEHLLTALVFAPAGGAYHKTAFVMAYEGVTYEGRLDLQNMDVSSAHIGTHVLEHCQWIRSDAARAFYERLGKLDTYAERYEAAGFWIRAIASENRSEGQNSATPNVTEDEGQLGWCF